jgi:hypothetical protein
LGDLGADGGNIKMDLKETERRVWTEFNWLRIRSVAGCCVPSGSMKDGEFLHQLIDGIWNQNLGQWGLV